MKLAFLGTGAMGGALARGVIYSGFLPPNQVLAYDPLASSLEALTASTGAVSCASGQEAVAQADIVVLCVKPQVVCSALDEVGQGFNPDKLLVSIAAGVRIERLESMVAAGTPIIRAMPNTPALVGAGATGYALGKACKTEHGELARKIFESVGLVVEVGEPLLDAVTGLSGSGPAFVYTFIEALADGAVSKGLPRALAQKLASQTVFGAAKMVIESGVHPAALRDQVTSPAGTTIAGLAELERSGLRAAVINAVQAAADRSEELST